MPGYICTMHWCTYELVTPNPVISLILIDNIGVNVCQCVESIGVCLNILGASQSFGRYSRQSFAIPQRFRRPRGCFCHAAICGLPITLCLWSSAPLKHSACDGSRTSRVPLGLQGTDEFRIYKVVLCHCFSVELITTDKMRLRCWNQ